MTNARLLPPLSLYIHIPWCIEKCPYCDFNSHKLTNKLPENIYIEALLNDLQQDLPLVWGRYIQTIFFGGGTPSVFSPAGIARLLSQLRTYLPILPDCEITLEANPGSIDSVKFQEFFATGINRISIGIQSFHDLSLSALGRIHDSKQAHRAIALAFKAGFQNINLDLMFALPQQTTAMAIADLQQAIAWQVPHISHYQLTIEAHTAFAHNPPSQLPDEDNAWAMQTACQQLLQQHGYQHYEISAYAKSKQACQHNINYWQFGDYLGIGAGAHAKITTQEAIFRLAKTKLPKSYLQAINNPATFRHQYHTLNDNDKIFEFMLNALRLITGFDSQLFTDRTYLPLQRILPTLQLAQQQGLLHYTDLHVLATPLGINHLNTLQSLFLDIDLA